MFFDMHLHAVWFSNPRQKAITNFATAEELLTRFPELQIDRGVLLPIVNHECLNFIQSNETVLDICAAHPGRFVPFCNLDPRMHGNRPDYDFTPVLEHYKGLGCKGVGEVCATLRWDDARVLNMLGHVERAGLPLLFHLGLESGTYGLVDDFGLPGLELVLQRFPRLNLIGHSMAFWSAISGDVTPQNWMGYPTGPVTEGGRLPELLRRYPNLWADISAGSGYNAISRDPDFGYAFLEEFQDRVVYGTDICWPGQEVLQSQFLLDGLATGRLSQQAFDKIARTNAEALLGV
ncbi:MAG: amidohydrolase family protein [Armatimonadetes bacterium]|nr:amidohydrolase family protein [Armatimonadota bacterium]